MFKSRLGDFIITERTPEGFDRVTYCVPEDRRPPHWHFEKPLPPMGKDVGDCSSPAFSAKIEEGIVAYDNQLEKFWRREELCAASGDRSARALAELYRAEDSLKGKNFKDLQPASQANNTRFMRKVTEWAEKNGNPSFATISRDALVDFLDLYYGQASNKAAVKSSLSLMMQTAVARNWRVDNPLKDVKVPNPTPPVRHFWTTDDLDAFVAAAVELGHPGIGGMLQFLYWSGQRPGDARVLKQGFNYSNGYFRLRQRKGGVVINGKLKLANSKAIDDLRINGSHYVFNHPNSGTAYTAEQVQQIFGEIRRILGVRRDRWLVMYTLRHTFVVRHVAAGTHPYDIAALTGHTKASVHKIMERYLIADSEQAMRALKNLNRAEGGTDDEFGVYDLNEAGFEPEKLPYTPSIFGDGTQRREAIKFAKLYLPADEVEQLILNDKAGILPYNQSA